MSIREKLKDIWYTITPTICWVRGHDWVPLYITFHGNDADESTQKQCGYVCQHCFHYDEDRTTK